MQSNSLTESKESIVDNAWSTRIRADAVFVEYVYDGIRETARAAESCTCSPVAVRGQNGPRDEQYHSQCECIEKRSNDFRLVRERRHARCNSSV